MFRRNAASSSRATILRPATETQNEAMQAINATPLIKLAKAVDNASFALDQLEFTRVITSDTVVDGYAFTIGQAFSCLYDLVMSVDEAKTQAPAGMDKSAVTALMSIVETAAANDKSELVAHAGSATKVEVLGK